MHVEKDSNGEVMEMLMYQDGACLARGGLTFVDTGWRASQTGRPSERREIRLFQNGGGEQKLQIQRYLLDANKKF